MNGRIAVSLAVAIAALLMAPAALAALPNDNFAGATTIADLPFTDDVDPTSATVEAGEPSCSAPADINTVWYRFTPTRAGIVRLWATGLVYFPTIAVFERSFGDGLNGLANIRCGYAGPTNVQVTAGRTYYVKVGFGWWETWSIQPYSLHVEYVAPPANDAFADAKAVPSVPYVDGLDATGSTLEPGEPTPASGFVSTSVWYAFTAPTAMPLTVSYDGSGLGVYTGSSLATLREVAGTRGPFQFDFLAAAGTTYYFQLSRFGFDSAGSTERVALRLRPGDTTPPEVIPFVYGTLGTNGWYVSDVSVSWSVFDIESPAVSRVGCDGLSVTADTPGATSSCSATSVGGTRTASVAVKRDATKPSLGLPQALVVDASSASGATVTSYGVTATDNLTPDSDLAIGCDRALPATFPIGPPDATVTCTARDLAGNTTVGSFSVHVRGAAEQLADLTRNVDQVGPGTSLRDKLANAESALAGGDVGTACNTLDAFRNAVAAQAGKKLTNEQASGLTTDAERIQSVIGC